MFPFWEKVVAPVLGAAEVQRLVEIGALRGENTQQILDHLGPDAELHVIDPVPDFDPDEHRERFGGQYVFHRDLSVNVMGDLPPMDAALIDGDHNWYTVYNECRLLAQVAREHDAPLPVMVLHDVCWPYGRRDLYYAPETIPEEFRKEWRQSGMKPGVVRLVPNGLNPTMCNAIAEGGKRNGVMTGLEDFIAEHDKPIRLLVLPIYFGLAIAVEEERLERQPALREFLDHLESPAGKDMLLELAESMRIDAMLFQHRIYFDNQKVMDDLAERYLESVKRGLTNEYYLENEVRMAHLAECIERGKPVELPRLRDPERHDTEALEALRTSRRTGQGPDGGPPVPGAYAFAPSRMALDHLGRCLDTLRTDYIRGDYVVCGAGRGGAAILMRAYLDAYRTTDREVWVADRFRAAADGRSAPEEADGLTDLRPDLNLVRDAFERFAVLDERTHFLQGDLAATLPDAPIGKVALIHLGPGLTGEEARAALEQLYPRLSIDGFVVVDQGADPEVRAAVDGFRSARGITDQETTVDATGTSWRKTRDVDPGGPPESPGKGWSRAPLATRPASDPVDLSVVVCFHDMAREAARSLHALSRTYQRHIEDLTYEVIVVENGSSPEQRLGEEHVRSFGPEFRYLDLGGEATPSPANALNRGIRESVGRNLALVIDGAHVLTPGVLYHGMTGLKAYEPAVVAVQPWYVGPGQQGEAMRFGYDQDAEDRLFENIGWPADGYRLFEISHFQGDRDWLDGLWESNCLFVPRKLLEQVGGFDEGFDTPGGGYTNLDIYERLGASPGVHLVSVLGEGSFHQVHGGTTTNMADPAERRERVFSYGQRYAELRGRPYTGPEKQIHYVGSFHGDPAKRTRARRMTGKAFDVDPVQEGPDGPLGKPVPIPDDLRDAFISAYYRSRAWRDTTWLGVKTYEAPTDLLAYQDLLAEVRPDVVIETGTRDGGRALFLATLCDVLGHGRVISVDNREVEGRPEHPRISYVQGRAHDDEVVAEVRSMVAEGERGLVVLGTRGARRRMHREFEVYAPFVPVGSYVVVEYTVLNGYPVDASFGPGPFEAVRRILNTRGDFVADTSRERHGLTFNLGGFLRRIS